MENELTGTEAEKGFVDNLDVISSVVITAFPEKPMCDNLVDIQLV